MTEYINQILEENLENEKNNFRMELKLCLGIVIFISILLFYYLSNCYFWYNALLLTFCIDVVILGIIYIISLLRFNNYLKYVDINNYSIKKSKIIDSYYSSKNNGFGTDYFVQLEGENKYRKTYDWVYSKIKKDKDCIIVFHGKDIDDSNWINLLVYQEER